MPLGWRGGRTAEDCGPYHWLVCDGRQGTAALAIGLEGGADRRGLRSLPLGGGGGRAKRVAER